MPDPQTLSVLIVEDNDFDAKLILDQLRQAGFAFDWRRVQTEREFVDALDTSIDVILADFNLPTFGSPRALAVLKERQSQVPLIVVSGSIGEETAVEALRGGAADYLLKDRLGRLGQAIARVIGERRLVEDKQRAEAALRDNEVRTKFALEAARVGVWEIVFSSGVVGWSPLFEALHGLPGGTFGGTLAAFLDCVHPDDRDMVRQNITSPKHRDADFTFLYRTRWPDKSTHWISATGRLFLDEVGTPVRAAGVGMDVTERHMLDEQNRQLQRVEAIGRLAGGIAHDFNNLLTAIQGYAELLSDEFPPDTQSQRDLAEIRRASDRAASLTRQLLAFSRRQMLEPRVLDVRDSVRSMESMLRRLIGEDIDIVFRTSPHDDGSRVKADPGQLEQVILNLAINARDAMPDGGTLLLEVSPVELDEAYVQMHANVKPGRYVMLGVSDTGTGMDAATQARVFEPFFTTKKVGEGTGLGLSTVYGIVQQSGGSIWVYSELGRGTTFKVYLPRVDEVLDDKPNGSAPMSLSGSETILVVEDEPGVRGLVCSVLERKGYHVLVAATPSEALALVDSFARPIHLVISDVVLPEMSGRVLVTEILRRRPGIKYFYTSGYTDNVIVHHGVLDRGTPFLQKPFTPEVLARKVREVLQ